jgi:membrane-associated phospholipid phosphatase
LRNNSSRDSISASNVPVRQAGSVCIFNINHAEMLILLTNSAVSEKFRRAKWFTERQKTAGFWMLLTAALVVGCSMAQAQSSDTDSSKGATAARASVIDSPQDQVELESLPRNIFVDQKNFWEKPFQMTTSEWQWTVPEAFVAAGFIASDTALEKHVPTSASTISRATTLSNAGTALMGGVGGGMFLLGHITQNDHVRETGLLSGEAGINALLETEIFHYAFGRQRPYSGSGRGYFFDGGDSFPSQHAAINWAIASVVAHEYPGPLTKLFAYGAAAGFSAARVAGRKHFASDVIVGSALGWYLGRQVFRSHSQYSDSGRGSWQSVDIQSAGDLLPDPKNMSSPYVPLDSWIYAAMARLIALGYIESADLGMRPWTRMECARLLREEAGPALENDIQAENGAEQLYVALKAEFAAEIGRWNGDSNLGVTLDSIYARFVGISDTPLRDGFHFGQTIINDYGRPYARGFNNVTGVIGHATTGPLSFFIRAEYEHAPSFAPFTAQSAQVVAAVDGIPAIPPVTRTAATGKLNVLEGYVGFQLENWQFTFGKQALWWGPDESGAMLFSNNAPSVLMLQINRVKPIRLPRVLGVFGPIRLSYIVGRLTGQHWIFGSDSGFVGSWEQTLSDQPFIVGEKISFKPTPDLELGISATALFGGPGVPGNFHSLAKAMFSAGNGAPGTSADAGDRRGGFDFSYRLPGLRDWLTFYGDAFTDDQSNPWFAWDKTALTSGLFLSHVPRFHRIDLRAEGIFSDLPGGSPVVQHGFFYSNDRFRSGYTNDGYLMGSWIGRQGQGAQAWANYWIDPRSKIQFSFRHQKVSRQFIPGGGSVSDFKMSGDYWVSSRVNLSAWVQHERWVFPLIQQDLSRTFTMAFQISFQPSADSRNRHTASKAHSGQP